MSLPSLTVFVYIISADRHFASSRHSWVLYRRAKTVQEF